MFGKVVIGRITICELVEEDSIEWDGAPVGWRNGVGRVLSRRLVLSWILRVLIEVEIVVNKVCAIWRGLNGGKGEEK